MSSTPNGPKGGDAENRQGRGPARPSLEQTFLGVAPPLNPPPPPVPANPAAASPTPNPAPDAPAPDAPAPDAPAPRGSAIVAAPMISLSGAAARGAGTAPTPSAAPAPQPPGLAVTMPPVQLGGGWESANVMPRPGNPDRTLQQGTPRALINAAVQPRAALSPQLARNAEPTPEPRPREVFDPRATAAPQPVPRADLGAQHGTALASDYLRQARDAVLGAPAAAARPQSPSLPPRPTTAAQYPAPSGDATAPSVAPPAIATGGGLPPTAEMPAVAPSAAERFGTQASVAPPPLEPEPARLPPPPASRPPAAAAPMAAVAAAPVQLHSAAPRSLAGTMLEPPPSAGNASSSRATSGTPAPSLASRFEQVPAARAPLAEQGSSALQIPIDQSLAEWNPKSAGPAGVTHTQGPPAKGAAGSQVRLIGLGLLALLAIGFVSFGDQLLGKSQKQHAVHPHPSATPAAGVALAPASPNPSAAGMPSTGASVNATTASLTAAPAPALAPATTAAGLAKASPEVAPAQADAKDEADAPESAREKAAAAERNKAAEAQASPEELAAANAARNVITGRYAEALPLYQALARSYPQNTAYAAMARVLKQKTETSAPAVAPKVTP